MERRLLVLYQSDKVTSQYWALYSGGQEEANAEGKIMRREDETLREVARIWISAEAELVSVSL